METLWPGTIELNGTSCSGPGPGSVIAFGMFMEFGGEAIVGSSAGDCTIYCVSLINAIISLWFCSVVDDDLSVFSRVKLWFLFSLLGSYPLFWRTIAGWFHLSDGFGVQLAEREQKSDWSARDGKEQVRETLGRDSRGPAAYPLHRLHFRGSFSSITKGLQIKDRHLFVFSAFQWKSLFNVIQTVHIVHI